MNPDWGLVERRLKALLPARSVVAKRQELLAYDCDGLTLHRHQPPLVVLPETTDEVAAVVRLCNELQVRSLPGAVEPGSPAGPWPSRAPW